MAVGGWDYYQGRCVLASNYNDTDFTRFIDEVIAVLTSMPNWSVKTSRTKYYTNGWFFVLSNSVTLAEVAMIFGRDGTSGTVLHSSNVDTGVTISATSYEFSWWVAYCPPGATFAGTNPATSGFVPAQGFRFSRMDNWSGEVDDPGYHWLHCLVRDNDDLILGWQLNGNENTVLSRLIMLGGLVTPIHASDTGALKNEGQIVCASGLNLSSNERVQYFKADSLTRVVLAAVSPAGWQWSGSSEFISHTYPWPYTEGILYKTGTPSVDGVVAGNMIKGYVNHEWYRFFQGNGPAFLKTRFDGGNFIFIADYAMIGWDPTNGEMR